MASGDQSQLHPTVRAAGWVSLFTDLSSEISTGAVLGPLVADLARAQHKGTAFSLYTFISGIAALPASLKMGALWSTAGPLAAFGLGARLAVLASVALMVVGR